MEIRTQERLEHCRRIDDRYSLAVSRHGKKAEANFDRKQHEVDRLLGLENFRAQGPHNAVATFGLGYAGFGNGWTDAKPRILYPKERKRPRRHLREICFSRNTLRHIARVDEVLVPMRLDIDYDKYKLRDVLTWNLFDDTMSIEIFAEHLCEDYGLPLNGFVSEIAKSLKGQLAEHHPHKFPEEVQSGLAATADPERMNYTEARDDDLRVCIKLDITVGALNLVDQIEWDLNNSANDPESYAASFCVELGLSCEFSTAIAHAIREQCQLYTKSLFLAGHTFDGKGVHDSDLRQALMPMIYSSSRPKHHMDQFAPTISDLVPEQLEKIERDREREGRRNRRQTRGKRGVILPDLHDLPKTYRSPYMNSVLVPDSQQGIDMPAKGLLTSKLYTDPDHVSDDERRQGTESPRPDRGSRSSRNVRGTSNNLLQDNTNTSRTLAESYHAETWSADPSTAAQSLNQRSLESLSNSQRRLPIVNRDIGSPYRGRNVKTAVSMPSWDVEMRPNGLNHVNLQHDQENYSGVQANSMLRRSTSSPPSLIVTLSIPKARLANLLELAKSRHIDCNPPITL